MLFLEDYLHLDNPLVGQEVADELLARITSEPGITLDKLLTAKVATRQQSALWVTERKPKRDGE